MLILLTYVVLGVVAGGLFLKFIDSHSPHIPDIDKITAVVVATILGPLGLLIVLGIIAATKYKEMEED